MKILVTGARGFVGRNVVAALELRPDVAILSPSRDVLDLLSNASVSTYVNKEMPDVVIHLAGESNPWSVGRLAMFDVNVMGTLRLIDALEKLPTGPRRRSFIFASAGYVYGPSTPLIVDESVSPRPFGDYAISKYCAEEILLAASENVRTVSARLFNVIGVGHSEKYVVPKLAAAFRRGDACLKVGNTSSIRDFIDVRDVAEALVHFGLIAEIEGPVNVCSGLGTSVGGIIQLMRDLSKREMKVEVQTSFARPGDNTHLVGSNNLLLSTGFELHYDLRASLEWMLTKSIAD